MGANPLLGVFFHWLGGFASASFYIPYRGVKRWAWETYWLVGGVFSWIIVPWILAGLMTRHLWTVLWHSPLHSLIWTYIFGVLWGLGGLTFGLTMRYLGLSLGMAIALGYTAVFGTLVPPIFRGQFVPEVLGTHSGVIILIGVAVCVVGIGCAGAAGISKERELSEEEKRASIKEFNLKRGLLVATFSGVMSACFAYGLAAGDPIKALTVQEGTAPLWQGLPVLVVLLAGGFTTNFIWCVMLHIRNRTGSEYISAKTRSEEPFEEAVKESIPLGANYIFSALAGTIWYLQFFFYTMGETQMGRFKFSSWTLHMASIIIFSTLWGIALQEWRGTGLRTRFLVACTLLVLVGSTVIVGYGNYLGLGSTASASCLHCR